MPDANIQPQSDDRSCPEAYPIPAHSATPSLHERLLEKISAQGPISFPEYLETVLYDPTDGYYARTDSQVGRGGDFYTSVSVGPLFGQLLARRFLKWWEENGKPSVWRLVEIGAHDGKLAEDILRTLKEISPYAWESLEYAIPEPLPRLRTAQDLRLRALAKTLRIASSLAELSEFPLSGIAFGNEVLDALPFHLVKMISGEWREMFVMSGENSPLEITNRSAETHTLLGKKLAKLGTAFPENYQTEIRTNFPAFLKSVSSCLTDGLLIFIDYGFAAPEYYDTHRTSGTLRTFSKHRAADDPLDTPGEIDITAHVDFTDLTGAATEIGYFPCDFSNQGSYLTHLAKDLILSGAFNDPKTIAQFQSLTHPAHLGGKFHVIEFAKKREIPPILAHRLAL